MLTNRRIKKRLQVTFPVANDMYSDSFTCSVHLMDDALFASE